jgi:membrane peptidoglycan carboxypeptidase
MKLFGKKNTLDKVFTNYKNDKKKPKGKLYKGFMLGLAGILASMGIIVGSYTINQLPKNNRYSVEKKFVLPMLESTYKLIFKKEITNIDLIQLNNFESHVIYKCFNDETNKNDLVFYKKGDNKSINLRSLDEKIIYGILSVEDPHFYTHNNMSFFDKLRVHRGVDWIATMRAFYNTKIKNGSIQGGSTITQQVIKKNLLNDAVPSRITRYDLKLEEILLAGKIEDKFGKDKVLETHINSFYIANNISGISAALQNYFGLNNINDASYEQILSIAAAISNPNNIFSKNRGVLYKISRGTTIDDLTESEKSFLNSWRAKYNAGANKLYETFKLIDKDEYQKLIISQKNLQDFVLKLQLREFNTIKKIDGVGDLDLIINRHIIENDFLLNGETVSGSYLLNEFPGIVEIKTGIDLKKNNMLERELLAHLQSNTFKKALIPIDTDIDTLIDNIHPFGVIVNNNGHIIAYYGSRDKEKFDFLSYTPKGVQNIINTGSAFKPIIMYFINSIENKTVDEKFLMNVSQYQNKPSNWDGNNNPNLIFSIEETLKKSLNRPTAYAWMEFPRVRQAIHKIFKDYGLKVFEDQEFDKYSISLGVDIEYPLFIPAMYGALVIS